VTAVTRRACVRLCHGCPAREQAASAPRAESRCPRWTALVSRTCPASGCVRASLRGPELLELGGTAAVRQGGALRTHRRPSFAWQRVHAGQRGGVKVAGQCFCLMLRQTADSFNYAGKNRLQPHRQQAVWLLAHQRLHAKLGKSVSMACSAGPLHHSCNLGSQRSLVRLARPCNSAVIHILHSLPFG